MNHFAGNMMQLQNKIGQDYLVMSDAAFTSLREDQKHSLAKYVDFIHYTFNSPGGQNEYDDDVIE